ncbi:hypothetical protein VINE108521_16135 [Vibrio neonatus]
MSAFFLPKFGVIKLFIVVAAWRFIFRSIGTLVFAYKANMFKWLNDAFNRMFR